MMMAERFPAAFAVRPGQRAGQGCRRIWSLCVQQGEEPGPAVGSPGVTGASGQLPVRSATRGTGPRGQSRRQKFASAVRGVRLCSLLRVLYPFFPGVPCSTGSHCPQGPCLLFPATPGALYPQGLAHSRCFLGAYGTRE